MSIPLCFFSPFAYTMRILGQHTACLAFRQPWMKSDTRMLLWNNFRWAYRQAFTYKTRSTRSEYWYFYLVMILIVLTQDLCNVLAVHCHLNSLKLLFFTVSILFGLVSLANFLPMVALTVRRLHDTGYSGWWYPASIIGLPLIAFVVSYAVTTKGSWAVIGGFVGFTAGSLLILVLTVLPGTPAENRYGDVPRDPYGEILRAPYSPTE